MPTNACRRVKILRKSARLVVCGTLFLAVGCGLPVEEDYPEPTPGRKGEDSYKSDWEKGSEGTVFGDSGLDLFGLGGSNKNNQGGPGISVNSYLWRASLDTIAFMPLSSADPFGGVIITDWYSPPEAPSERYKMSVYILGRQLRADGIKVAVFRQQTKGPGRWLSKSVSKNTATSLENKILSRARQLRIATEHSR